MIELIIITIVLIVISAIFVVPYYAGKALQKKINNEWNKVDVIVGKKRLKGCDLEFIFSQIGYDNGFASPTFIGSLECVAKDKDGELFTVMLFPSLRGKIKKQHGSNGNHAEKILQAYPELYQQHCLVKSSKGVD